MNKLLIRILNKTRRVIGRQATRPVGKKSVALHCQGQSASDLIRSKLTGPEPAMITRFGNTEMNALLRHWSQKSGNFLQNSWGYVMGKQGPFWWDDKTRNMLRDLTGVFPCDDDTLVRFSEKYLVDLKQIDVLGSWLEGEVEIAPLFPDAKLVPLSDLEPFYHQDPWTTALEGRTVLVIHPFDESIRRQYEKRTSLFAEPKMLPQFKLKTLKTVQSLGGQANGFKTWFEALDSMCEQVRQIEFDVALIGAGGYGLPLAAFVKRMGRKAVHLGGATQLLFGIRGKRWDERPFYQGLYNEHWSRPLSNETPSCYQSVESGCYW